MSRELLRLSGKIYGTPLLSDQNTIDGILAYLESRNAGMDTDDYDGGGDGEILDKGEVGVALLNINGPLSYNMNMIQALCGGGALASYDMIRASMDAVVAEGNIKTLGVIYNSGGGEARGAFATAKYMRDLADANGIEIISFIEGDCCSAAYALAATSHQVLMMDDNATSVGSIGVRIALKNPQPKEIAEGNEILHITSSEGKVPFAEDGTFREDFIAEMQESISVLYEDFVDHVVSYRSMTRESVIATDARTYQPAKALELGLVDGIISRQEFFELLADVREQSALAGGELEINEDTKLDNLDKVIAEEVIAEEIVAEEAVVEEVVAEEVVAEEEASDAEQVDVLDELKAQMAEMAEVLAAQKEQLDTVTAERDELKGQDEEREVASLKEKISGYSFSTEGMVEDFIGMTTEGREALLSTLDGAEASLKTAQAEQAAVEKEAVADMFVQKAEGGETVELGVSDSLKAAVANMIKNK